MGNGDLLMVDYHPCRAVGVVLMRRSSMPQDPHDLPQLSVTYVVLGMLDEYMGRPPRGLERGFIEFFWRRERAAADTFERCLDRLQQEYQVATTIHRSEHDGQVSFQSHELARLIDSFYEGAPTLHYGLFPPRRNASPQTDDVRAAFLKGVYLRSGTDWHLDLHGGFERSFAIYRVLYDLYCPGVTMTTSHNEGGGTRITITPTAWLTRLFEEDLPW
jgi:hypothetical protein